MGHLHLLVSDVDLHRKLWVEGLGARPAMLGPMEVLLLPDVVVILRKGEPAGGSEGSTVNHLGFLVKDREAIEKRWQAVGGEIYERRPSPGQVYLKFPDGIKVELTEDKTLKAPVAHHHIHFYTASADETKAWYVKMFDATPGKRGKFEAADLPGVNLSFSQAKTETTGTRGRGVDHIGFEVHNLEAFCKQMEAQGVEFDMPYRRLERLGISIAFFTDPWGTYVELTEGLDKL
ncbi:MAG: VOC family protein [bacterium]|nr:VOC family protein [bacterium]